MQQPAAFQLSSESDQIVIEKNSSLGIVKKLERNKNFFRINFPALYNDMEERKATKFFPFINKEGQFNFINYENKTCVYPLHSEASQLEHAKTNMFGRLSFNQLNLSYSPSVTPEFNSDVITGFKPAGLERPCDTVFVLGIGSGIFIPELIKRFSCKRIVFFDNSYDFILGSLKATSWDAVLADFLSEGGEVIFVLSSDQKIAKEFVDVVSYLAFGEAIVYKHINNPSLDALLFSIKTVNDKGKFISTYEKTYKSFNSEVISYPSFSKPINSVEKKNFDSELISNLFERKNKNLKAFKKYYKDIYEALLNYSSSQWFLLPESQRSLNLVNIEREVVWYSDWQFDNDNKYEAPNFISLTTNLSFSGGKLKEYTFFKYSKEIFKNLESVERVNFAPKTLIPSLILYNPVLGYSLDFLSSNYDIQSLVLFEPNFEFFVLSLYSFDWCCLLKDFDTNGKQLYLNFGDDGSLLKSDIMAALRRLDGYYFYFISFYSDNLSGKLLDIVSSLKTEIKNNLVLTENFHYSAYAHSHSFRNLKNPKCKLNFEKVYKNYRDLPVLVVGNGPSLDRYYNEIISNRANYLVVSCGTALGALYRYGIKPDLHAEVEQNFCTHQIIFSTTSKEYLNDISLLAPVDVHPETANLFKCHFAMKSYMTGGMNTLRLALNKVKASTDPLIYPFPTVTNFALSSLLSIGFKNITLVGVDMGFKSVEHHHSKGSAYYNSNSEEKFRYSESGVDLFKVSGNRGGNVLSKPEFILAAENIGHLIKTYSGSTIYNLSDGISIEGSHNIDEQFLSINSSGAILQVEQLFESAFSNEINDFLASFISDFLDKGMSSDCYLRLKQTLVSAPYTAQELRLMLQTQSQALVSSYQKGNILDFAMLSSLLGYIQAVIIAAYVEFDNCIIDKSRFSIIMNQLENLLNDCFYEFNSDPRQVDKTEELSLSRAGRSHLE